LTERTKLKHPKPPSIESVLCHVLQALRDIDLAGGLSEEMFERLKTMQDLLEAAVD